MKKIICCFIWVNIGMCFIGTFIIYSRLVYKNVHRDKVAIQIVKPESYSNLEFIEELKAVCKETKVDIFYERIEGATTGHPIYYIYKTNINKNFLEINLRENKKISLKKGEYFSVKINNIAGKRCVGKIVGSSLINDVVIYNFDELSNINLDRNTFYVNKKNLKKLSSYLSKKEIETSIIDITNEEEGDFFWKNSQIILLFLLMLIIFYYFFSNKKKIIIKKLNGYGNKDIVLEELERILRYIIPEILLFCILIYIKYSGSVLIEYLKNAKIYIVGTLICIILEFFVSSLIIFTHSDESYIKGKLKCTEVKIICLIAKGTIVVLIAFQIGQIQKNIYDYWMTTERFIHMKNVLDNKFYLPFNTLSSDIDLNFQYYSLKSSEFFKDLILEYGEKNIIVADTDLYKEEGIDEKSKFITVNATYLDANHLIDSKGKRYLLENIDYKKNYLFLPDNISPSGNEMKEVDSFVNYLREEGQVIEIRYYIAGRGFKTYDIECGNSQGIIHDALLFLPNRELLSQYALSLFSNNNILINTKDTKDIKKIIEKNGLQNVILEKQMVSEYYRMQLLNWKIEITVELANLGSLIAVYILSIFLLTYIFLYDERKSIVVKKIQGFGIERYIKYYIQNIGVFLIIMGISYLLEIYLIINVIGLVIDFTIFNSLCRYWESGNVVQILKGK